MALICIPKSVLSSANCQETPAGLSNFLFAVPVDDVDITVDDTKNQYTIAAKSDGAPQAGAALQGYRIDFKSQTGQYTSEDNGTGKAWTARATGRVELSGDDMAWTSRVLHNSDKYLYFIATGKKIDGQQEFIVIGNENGEAEWSVTADTGMSRQDDHGHTFNISCGYQLYPTTKFVGTIEQKDNSRPTPVQHQFVDLGLPSGTLWATTNVGATNPEDYGDYFAWGETETKEDYSWSTHVHGTSTYNPTKYNRTDGLTQLELEDDAAYMNWNKEWCMPTPAQWQELINNCTWTWEQANDVNGRRVTGPNGNSIFLPAAGYRTGTNLGSLGSLGGYWSSSLDTSYSFYARFLYFSSANRTVTGDEGDRVRGRSVRPVRYQPPVL